MSNQKVGLVRGLGLRAAVAFNMIDMVGVGPFITLPLIVQAMGGPQAMLGWVLGAAFALCDGLIWAELGAAMPGAGGSYLYLSEAFGRERWGRFFSFLFVWQTAFSAPLTMASGGIGLALYAAYLWPGLNRAWFDAGPIHASGAALVAAGSCLLALALAYRRIAWIGRLSQWLWAGVMATMLWVIVAGATHFHAALAFDFPPHAFALTPGFRRGLGLALVIATYDYWGYENANFLGGEVRRPERTIPRAIVISILLVGALYLVMNISVLGVVPWRDLMGPGGTPTAVISIFMQRIYGAGAARLATGLIIWTAFASVFSILLGYSRVLYAAARDGNFFAGFGRLRASGHFPAFSLFVLGVVAAGFCFFGLEQVIAALVVMRVLLQYLLQAVALVWLRRRRPELPRPFRMPLYPLPLLLAVSGFLFLLFAPAGAAVPLTLAVEIMAAGITVFVFRAWRTRTWPW